MGLVVLQFMEWNMLLEGRPAWFCHQDCANNGPGMVISLGSTIIKKLGLSMELVSNVLQYNYQPWDTVICPIWLLIWLAMGPNEEAGVSQRPVTEEPMYMVLNLGISENFGAVQWAKVLDMKTMADIATSFVGLEKLWPVQWVTFAFFSDSSATAHRNLKNGGRLCSGIPCVTIQCANCSHDW